MAEIIETQKLPVTITKVKIGKKDLTKKILDQIPRANFVYFKHDDGATELGLPYVDELVFDRNRPYIIDGTLLGYIRPTWDDLENRKNARARFSEFNCDGYLYFIIWYNEAGELRKGYIDDWTIEQLGLELEQIFI